MKKLPFTLCRRFVRFFFLLLGIIHSTVLFSHAAVRLEIQGNQEIKVELPEGFSDLIDIYTRTNLVEEAWELAAIGIITDGNTNIIWQTDDLLDASSRFFFVGNGSVDTDGDQLPNAQEIYIYRTDPNDPDMDDDGTLDGDETHYDGTYGDLDGFLTDPFTPDFAAYPLPEITGMDGPAADLSEFPPYMPPTTSAPLAADVPEISEWIRQAKPEDTLVLSGELLSEALVGYDPEEIADLPAVLVEELEGRDTRFLFFAETEGGRVLREGVVQRLDGRQAAVTLPADLPPDEMYMMWPGNKEGFGRPVAINQTEIWWIGPDLVTREESFSIFGRNLRLGDGISYAYIEELDRWLMSTDANPYRADFEMPVDVPNGTYTIWAHNGHGGEFGWSRSIALVVEDPLSWEAGSVTAASASYADVVEAIESAGDFYVINIPEGTCSVEEDIELPDNIWLKGAGQGLTIFTVASNYDLEGKSGDAIIDNGKSYGGEVPILHNSKITDITFDYGDGTVIPENLVIVTGSRTIIENCTFTHESLLAKSEGNVILDANGGVLQPMLVRNCTFNQSDRVALGTRVFYDGNTNNGMFDLGSLVKVSDSIGVSITGNIGQHYDESDYTDGYGWCQGRFIGGNGRSDWCRNVYIADNTTIDMAPRFNRELDKWDDNQVHQNAGEMIMCEGQVAEFRGEVVSATENTVTSPGFPDEEDDFYGMVLVIVKGRGFGQHRIIETLDPGSGEITLTEPWRVIPDEGSVIIFGSFFSRFAIYRNQLDGVPHVYEDNDQYINTASAGVSLYGGWLDSVVDNNEINEVETALYNWSLVNEEFSLVNRIVQPNYFNLFMNNRVNGCRYAMTSNIYGADKDNVIGDRAIFGTIWRSNSFDTVTGSLVSESTDNYDLPIEMSTFDMNVATNGIATLGKFQTRTPIHLRAVYDGQDTAEGPEFEYADYHPTFRGNNIKGFFPRFSGEPSGGILELPIRSIRAVADLVEVEVWNSGTDPLYWTAIEASDWLTLVEGEGTVATNNLHPTKSVSASSGVVTNGQDVGALYIEIDRSTATGKAVVLILTSGQVRILTIDSGNVAPAVRAATLYNDDAGPAIATNLRSWLSRADVRNALTNRLGANDYTQLPNPASWTERRRNEDWGIVWDEWEIETNTGECREEFRDYVWAEENLYKDDSTLWHDFWVDSGNWTNCISWSGRPELFWHQWKYRIKSNVFKPGDEAENLTEWKLFWEDSVNWTKSEKWASWVHWESWTSFWGDEANWNHCLTWDEWRVCWVDYLIDYKLETMLKNGENWLTGQWGTSFTP